MPLHQMVDQEASKDTSAWSFVQPDGYPALSDFIALDPDHETYVFRKFKRLGVQNILHLQGELIELEHEIAVLDRTAAASTRPDLHSSMRSWATLQANCKKSDGDHERKRQEIAIKLENRLKNYYEALMLQRGISMIDPPSSRVLGALRQWMSVDSNVPGGTTKLDGRDKYMFNDEHDLAALKQPQDRDMMSRLLRDHWPFPSERLSPHEWSRTRHFKEQHLVWLVTSLDITIASVLLTCPIIVLYFVTNPHARLALVITFILLFALGLSLSTSANRDSIFAATAAYAAVLVVFVSGNLANSS